MKLADYARKAGVSYRTAWRWWKTGVISGYQLPTGTIIVDVDETRQKNLEPVVCIYARVSSTENKKNLETQAERLTQYALAKGYRIYKVVKEIGSGLNDNRKKLASILTDKNYNILLVEHKDRLARFGIKYLIILLEETGKKLEVVNLAPDGKEELIQDLIAIITSFCARIYGQRRSKRKTEKLISELKKVNKEDNLEDEAS